MNGLVSKHFSGLMSGYLVMKFNFVFCLFKKSFLSEPYWIVKRVKSIQKATITIYLVSIFLQLLILTRFDWTILLLQIMVVLKLNSSLQRLSGSLNIFASCARKQRVEMGKIIVFYENFFKHAYMNNGCVIFINIYSFSLKVKILYSQHYFFSNETTQYTNIYRYTAM